MPLARLVSILLLLGTLVLLGACGRTRHAFRTSSVSPTGAAVRSWNLAGSSAGALPAGFHITEGTWEIADTAAGRGLLQRARNDNPVFNVVLVDGTERADVDIHVTVHAIDGVFDQGGGPVWRAADGSNYYIARWNPLEDNCRVYKVVDGVRTQLGTAETEPGAMARAMRVVMQGRSIRCWLDGELVVELEDDTFSEPGRIGLWAKADARTLFTSLTLGTP